VPISNQVIVNLESVAALAPPPLEPTIISTVDRALTPVERLIEFFEHAHYETTVCNTFNEFEGIEEDCHSTFDVANNKGQIHQSQTYTYSNRTQTSSSDNNYTITSSTTTPLAYSEGYWWIPNVGSTYEVGESFSLNVDVYSGSPAYSWSPGGIVELTIAGKSFSAQEYSAEYIWTYDDRHAGTAWKVVMEFHKLAYFDTETGLLLKLESNATIVECVNSYDHPELYGPQGCNAAIGQTESNILELAELEWTSP